MRGVLTIGLLAVSMLFLMASAQAAPGLCSDPSFGSGGVVTTSIGGVDDEAHAVALQPDGKIIVGGYCQSSPLGFALVRYNPDGSLDTSFGSGGKVTTGNNGMVNALALQPDGKIVAAGESWNGSTNYVFALARYNADGSLDTSFGSGGVVMTTVFPSNSAQAYAVAVEPDGKIVVAGRAYDAVREEFALARYNADGSLDTSFGSGGIVTTAFGTGDAAGYGVVVQSDAKVVVAGYSSSDPLHTDIALARYDANGSLDTSFGSGGTVTTAIGGADDEAYAVALQPDAKIVAAGESDAWAPSTTSLSLGTTRTARSTRASATVAQSRPPSRTVPRAITPTPSLCSRTAEFWPRATLARTSATSSRSPATTRMARSIQALATPARSQPTSEAARTGVPLRCNRTGRPS